jgi:hypothetical protein
MRIGILLIAAMAATAPAAPAAAQEKPAVQAQAQADPASDLVCRRVEETGSLVKKKKRVCHTRAEWDRIAAMSRDAMGQGQMSGGSSGN